MVLLRLAARVGTAEASYRVPKTFAQHEEAVRRLALLIALYALPAVAAMRPIIDPDIWWHLRTGQWIVAHGTVPTTDPFSLYGIGKPWVAYSWLFEILVYSLYRACGLFGPVLYTAVMSLTVAVALHRLVRRCELPLPQEIALTALGFCGLLSLVSPRPWLLTILCFIIEMHILMVACRSGDVRRLWLLPPLFALWANVHIQFVYGL